MTGRTRHLLRRFFGATASDPGKEGLVTPPAAGDQAKFLRGDATWATAGGGSGFTVVGKTADESLSSSTTLQDDNHLTFAVDASSTYAFRIRLIWYCPDTDGGVKVGFSVPSGASGGFIQTMDSGSPPLTGTGANVDGSSSYSLEKAALSGTIFSKSYSGSRIFDLVGYINTSGTSGNLQMQWAQYASKASATYVYKGSYIEYIKIV